MNRIRALALVFALFLAQNALEGVFPGATPPLLVVGVIFFALSEGPGFGLVVGCFSGAFLELFSVGRIGAQIAALGALGLACGFASTKIFRDSLLTQLLLPVVGIGMLAAADALFYGEAPFSPAQFAFAALLSPVIFAVLKRAAGIRRLS